MNMNLMKDFAGNLDFGPIKGNQFKLAVTGGVAIRKLTDDYKEQWIVYNRETGQVTNVGSLSFKASGMLWKMPVNTVSPGDLILHEGQPCYVLMVNPTSVKVYGVNENREFTFSPVQNVFNFPIFYTKVTNVMEGGNPFGALNTEQPQNGGMPFNPMMMAMMDGDFNMKDMMKLQMLTSMTQGGGFNPMAMMFLNKMEDGDDSDEGKGFMESYMEMMMMQNMFGGNANANPLANMFAQPQPATRDVPENEGTNE